MKHWLTTFFLIVPSLAVALPVLDFRDDLAFQATTVNAFAAQVYRQRISKLNANDKLNRDQDLLARVRFVAVAFE